MGSMLHQRKESEKLSIISNQAILTLNESQAHSHSHAHMILPLEQTFRIRFSGHDYELTTHQICFVPPGVLHEYSCSGRALALNIPEEMIKSSDLLSLTENCVLEIDENLEPLVQLIRHEVSSEGSNKESMRYLYYYLYDKFVERHRLPSLRYMHENYAGPISIAGLAAMENYNVSYYTDWFKKKVGCMPSEYLQMVRIDKAKEILATTRYRILDVALQVGYTNGSSFTRAFRSVTGMTPHQYRKYVSENRQN